MLLGAAFVISVGAAMLVFRRSRRRMRWLVAAIVLFVVPAAFTIWAWDGRTKADWDRTYSAGVISYNAYQEGLRHVHDAMDAAAGVGLGGALLLVCFGVLFERVRAYDDRQRSGPT